MSGERIRFYTLADCGWHKETVQVGDRVIGWTWRDKGQRLYDVYEPIPGTSRGRKVNDVPVCNTEAFYYLLSVARRAGGVL